MEKLRSLIVDDEALARKNLHMMLEEFCPEIEVVGEADGVGEAKEKIQSLDPDVVFLDIRMPSGSEGFQLLEQVQDKKFMVVFVTAFKDYAVKAFNANAVHYILKPIDIDDLTGAVEKLIESRENMQSSPENYDSYLESLKNLSDSLVHNKKSHRITISHTKGLKLVDDHDILRLEASGNCTLIYFKDGSRYLDTRTMKIYEEMLDDTRFYRVHKSHIINLDYLKEYVSEDGNTAVLEGDVHVPIARNRLTEFIKTMKSL